MFLELQRSFDQLLDEVGMTIGSDAVSPTVNQVNNQDHPSSNMIGPNAISPTVSQVNNQNNLPSNTIVQNDSTVNRTAGDDLPIRIKCETHDDLLPAVSEPFPALEFIDVNDVEGRKSNVEFQPPVKKRRQYGKTAIVTSPEYIKDLIDSKANKKKSSTIKSSVKRKKVPGRSQPRVALNNVTNAPIQYIIGDQTFYGDQPVLMSGLNGDENSPILLPVQVVQQPTISSNQSTYQFETLNFIC